MTKEKFKIIKDFGNPRKSERRKYLETMMADMGLVSLDELHSDEERRRWIKAVTPQPIVEKKLKEMGYSMFSNTNKRSLGSLDRPSDIRKLYKIASISAATNDLTLFMQVIKDKLNPDTLYQITGIIAEDRLKDKNFNSNTIKSEIKASIEKGEEDPDFFFFYVEELVHRASKYNSEYLKSTEVFVAQDSEPIAKGMRADLNLNMTIDHENRDEVAMVQQKLEDLNYNLESFGVDGKFGSTTESAVILFQQEHALSPTGIVDSNTFNTLMNTTLKRVVDLTERSARQAEGAVTLEGLSNVKFVYKNKANISEATPMLHEYLKILNEVAADDGSTIEITSAFRDSYNQARIMLDNYNRRTAGSKRANRYLSRLYRRLPRIDEIVDIYAGSLSKTEKIKAAEDIIEASWAKTGHRGGYSVDIRLGKRVREVLMRTQDLAVVDVLKETDHFHVTIKSLNPALAKNNEIRSFTG